MKCKCILASIFVKWFFLRTTFGLIGEVFNVTTLPVKYFETTSIKISWSPPQLTKDQNLPICQYLISYCELNKLKTCVNTTLFSELSVTLTNLKAANLYQYTIYVFDSHMNLVQHITNIFKTSEIATCTEDYFSCVVIPQCVFKNRTCNLLQDCSDNSDEKIEAGCAVPVSIPTNLHVKFATLYSITLEWNAINDAPKDRLTNYQCQLIESQLSQYVEQSFGQNGAKSADFSGLIPNTTYTFRVRAINPSGSGPWSNDVIAYTTACNSQTQFTCVQDKRCVLIEKMCDGSFDCADQSDETAAAMCIHIGVVRSMTAVPVLYFESSSVKFSWKAPINDNGDNVLDFKYLVTYCELNLPQTCKNTTLTRDLFAVVENLLPNTSYMYTITPFDSKMISGDANNDTFKTLLKNTCNSDLYFTCVKDKGCVLKASLCDGVFDCEDESDETSSAMCSLPVSKPSIGTFVEETPLVLKVTWNLIESPKERIQSYEVEIVGFSSQAINVSQLAPSTKSLNATFIGVSPNQMFFVRVRAINPSGFGPWSDSLNITTVRVDVELIGPVQEYSAKPVEYMESTSFMVFWKPPLNLGRNKAVYYRVLLCSLNIPCENLSSRTTNANISFSGLTPNFLYQYTIFVYNENDETNASLASSSAFKTLQKDSCPPQYFACTSSPGCVLLSLCCNNIVDCVDGSDEKIDANCSLPSEITGFKMSEKNDSSVTVQFDAIIQPQERVLSYEVENLVNNDVKTVYQELKAYYPPILVSFNNLSSATFYSFRVRSRNLSGYSKWSILLNLTTTGCAATIYAISVAIPVQNITSASNFTMQHENLTFSYFGSFDNMKSGWNSAQRAGLSVGFFVIASLVGVGGTLLYRRSLSSKKGVVNNEDGDIIELS